MSRMPLSAAPQPAGEQGYAAGTSATLAALNHDGKVRAVNILNLQNTIIDQNGIIITEGRTFDEEVEVEVTGESEAISEGSIGLEIELYSSRTVA